LTAHASRWDNCSSPTSSWVAVYMLSPESGVLTGALVDYDQRVAGGYPE
jgi:hypothetical protein